MLYQGSPLQLLTLLPLPLRSWGDSLCGSGAEARALCMLDKHSTKWACRGTEASKPRANGSEMEVFLSKCRYLASFRKLLSSFQCCGQGAQRGLFGPQPLRSSSSGPFAFPSFQSTHKDPDDRGCCEPLTSPIILMQPGCLPKGMLLNVSALGAQEPSSGFLALQYCL